jgi:hypothetical protein
MNDKFDDHCKLQRGTGEKIKVIIGDCCLQFCTSYFHELSQNTLSLKTFILILIFFYNHIKFKTFSNVLIKVVRIESLR